MVRIVKESPEFLKQTTCKNCSTVLEYTQSEVKEYHGVDYSGGPDGIEWIDCPKCSKKVVLKSW